MILSHLIVLAPGLQSLLVDTGRPSYRSLGVSVGGAADRFNLTIGNALVGNSTPLAALEITLAGPTLLLPDDAPGSVACVVQGAPFDLTLHQVDKRQKPSAGTTFTLQPGDRLQIGGTPVGARGYLCVAGGFQTPLILGSRSALRPLQVGDLLPCPLGRIGGRFVDLPAEEDPGVLHILPGGQSDWFPSETLRALGESILFTVSPASNRMGLRLQGPPLPVPDRELVSEPVCPGTVQVTRDGQCIVLGVDGQTIGGYPKIGHVISADLDRLGQLRPGQVVRFRWVDLEEAEQRANQRRRRLHEWVSRLLWE